MKVKGYKPLCHTCGRRRTHFIRVDDKTYCTGYGDCRGPLKKTKIMKRDEEYRIALRKHMIK